MLGALVISETSQLPKPPVMAGITVKEKRLTKAWAVTAALWIWASQSRAPG